MEPESEAQRDVSDLVADAAEHCDDKQDVEQPDAGAADGVEAAHRVDRDHGGEQIAAGAIANAASVRSDHRDGDALERLRILPVAGAAVADGLVLGHELMRLRAGADHETAAYCRTIVDAFAVEGLQ